jgi:hypothetical protein
VAIVAVDIHLTSVLRICVPPSLKAPPILRPSFFLALLTFPCQKFELSCKRLDYVEYVWPRLPLIPEMIILPTEGFCGDT